ncbi:vWA domain-containing protein [Alkaliphilus oremlandii]|uniref:VWFA domain-containing protein n=1 Tax=Alkaliphilus oremlandii (strain OhILAs) TaxID=350688 RepID=A8MLS4_ALKOO|nr:VWA domain-containing protein [Alkaliphilus oremlandii]ABW17991.1 conserved hypothetical protein [Alkaliphilus oremlandii OhILAs]
MERDVMIKQMILVTDGQSNVGGSPIIAAEKAYRNGIIVNTIGIVDGKESNEDALNEIVEIAKAGGGTYEYSYINELFQTMQSLTYQTVNKTLQEVVSKQLKEMIGQEIHSMEPASRSKILNYIDDFSEDVGVQCCILLDSSGSMANKIHLARHSILDLIHSFKGRRGKVEIAVIAFPGENMEICKVLHDFNEDSARLERGLYNISPKGGTPTASAIEEGIKLIHKQSMSRLTSNEVIEVSEYIV